MEKVAFVLFLLFVLMYIMAIATALIAAFPWGVLGFIPIFGVGILFVKVVRDRLNNEEDNYYSKHINQ